MTVVSYRCARCGALSRTWPGVLEFARPGTPRQGRPACVDRVGCRRRRDAVPPNREVWLDEPGRGTVGPVGAGRRSDRLSDRA